MHYSKLAKIYYCKREYYIADVEGAREVEGVIEK
jgi:hypothetical protein